MRDAELATFASLDPEARRLVLESIAGSVSDDEEDDDGSAGLAAALVAEAERIEQLSSTSGEQQHATKAEAAVWNGINSAHSSNDSMSSSRSSGTSVSGSGDAFDFREPLQPTVSRPIHVTSPAEAASSDTQATGAAMASVELSRLSPLSAAELDDGGEEEQVDWEQRDPKAVAACVAASGDWSRIVRCAPG